MTKELIVAAAVLGTALTAGWFIPIGIEAAYTGDRVYQSEMISKNDVDIHSFSLLGRKKEIEVFDMRPASLNGEDLEFDISASNMTTTLDVDVIPVDKCIWEYNGTVYEGDRFNRDKLSGYVAYEDGRREALKDFTLKYAPTGLWRGIQRDFRRDPVWDRYYFRGGCPGNRDTNGWEKDHI